MTFEMKGAYIDLLIFQFNNHQFTEAQAKQVLSICFASVWEVLQNKFKKDGEFYFNERLRSEIDKRRAFSESRRINALHEKRPRKVQLKAYAKHMGNENENINRDIINNKCIKKTPEKSLFLDAVLLTEAENQKLIAKYGQDKTSSAIYILNNAIMSKGYKYKSHYHTLIGWPMKEAQGGNTHATAKPIINTTWRNTDVHGLSAEAEAAADEINRRRAERQAKAAESSANGNT